MKYITALLLSLPLLLSYSCKTKEAKPLQVIDYQQNISTAEKIINNAIAAHGGNLYDDASYAFTFRGDEYTFTNNNGAYKYTVTKNNGAIKTVDVLENGKFTRYQQNKKVNLSTTEIKRYTGALNSVIYFTLLPYKLNDASVNKTDKGLVTIKNKEYNVIQVTFDQEGGGEDYQDMFYYWTNTHTNTVDYIAYKYDVNGGGIRFRSAYNQRNVDGILFQDYVNYKVPKNLNLSEIPKLYENDKLEEVSKIELENIVHLPK